ncbi:hypothetical protein pb186bvf_016232 [Paramecium bursaria]
MKQRHEILHILNLKQFKIQRYKFAAIYCNKQGLLNQY